ncbi:lantibiotic dehydratase family protein (plasmid) [Streptomyces viridifaciens]|nr:lantibiotic dehydratase family protein [Streptomyces viridifaciens]
MTRSRPSLYRSVGDSMLRAAVSLSAPKTPEWPGRGATGEQWRAWLAGVWADDAFRQTVAGASPDLARRVEEIVAGRLPSARRLRRAALAVARYTIRYAQRSTPFGRFAGVALVGFGQVSVVRFGDRHEVVGRPDPVALDAVVSDWEADSERMAGVEVCVNSLVRRQDGRVCVPSEGPAEYSLALSPALALILDAAKAPIAYSELADKVAAEFPQTEKAQRTELLSQLLRVRVLRSQLRAPATFADPLGPLPAVLRESCDRTAAVDLGLDAAVRLPHAVELEAQTAAAVLTRLATHPAGTPVWRRYTERFLERYGEGAVVALEQLTDPERGLGRPEGFGQVVEPPRPMTRRDRLLLELAGTAAVEGTRAVVLSGAMIERLEAAAGEPAALTPPHLEVCVQVQAGSLRALDRGDFRLRVATVSRAAGSMTGRFWHLFPQLGEQHAALPTVEPGAELVQLSFHAGRVPADLLTRAPQVLPRVVSVGEFRHRGPGVLFPCDLAVGACDGRLYLVEAATGRHLELLAPTAINFLWNNYTPPLARFLAEISRAAAPQVTWFDWGAAWTLPFTPALHYRRTVLVAARWQLPAQALPGRAATLEQWAGQLRAWMGRFKVPERVLLAEDDQQLPLDLSLDMHLDVLRAHLAASPTGVAVLHEAPPPDADGWIGGRAHSIVVPMAAAS